MSNVSYVCTKRCYRGGRMYKPGDTWGGKGDPNPKEFTPANSGGLTAPKKELAEESRTLFQMQQQKRAQKYTPEEQKVRRSLGHKHNNDMPARKDAEDPFADMHTEVADQQEPVSDFLS